MSSVCKGVSCFLLITGKVGHMLVYNWPSVGVATLSLR